LIVLTRLDITELPDEPGLVFDKTDNATALGVEAQAGLPLLFGGDPVVGDKGLGWVLHG
jgi:hypothetical protein